MKTVNFQRQINLVENLVVAAGAHELKFGADYRRLTPTRGARVNYGINVNFDDVAAAIADMPSSVIITAGPARTLLFTNFSAYAQDTWRATRRLTLNYGLRWEVNPPPLETGGLDAFAIIGLDNPATMTLAPN